ncbi:MAG TPA: hypothetical protein VFR65_00645 [Nitrososphaeraceae archaeon]|nr:hypothetical protein [Nitrososphaeraceae archaeon]
MVFVWFVCITNKNDYQITIAYLLFFVVYSRSTIPRPINNPITTVLKIVAKTLDISPVFL